MFADIKVSTNVPVCMNISTHNNFCNILFVGDYLNNRFWGKQDWVERFGDLITSMQNCGI